MYEDTITKVLEVRRALNEQLTTLLFVDTYDEQDEKDIADIKAILNGANGRLMVFAERMIRKSKKTNQ